MRPRPCGPGRGGILAVRRVYPRRLPASHAGRWTAARAETSLAFLARHLEHTIGGPDLAWWQLHKAVRTASGLVAGLAAGLVIGLWAGLVASMLKTTWPSYMITRAWLVLHHQLPWPLMSFLADAHQRGVLRQAGAVYQFRHIELQHRLANRDAARHAIPSSPSARP